MIWQLLVCSGSIATNVFGLGEVAEPECLIEAQNLIIKNE
jgi:hypothetical protein